MSAPPAPAPGRGKLFVDLALGILIGWFAAGSAAITHRDDFRGGPGPRHPASDLANPMIWELLLVGAVLMAVAIVLRRLYPRIALLTVIAGIGAYAAGGGSLPPIAAALALVGYAVGSCRPQQWLPLTLLLIPAVALREWRVPGWGFATGVSVFAIIVCAAALLIPALIAMLRAANRHAAQRGRDAELERVVSAERLRVAREVHDIVGHSLSVISLQAGVALRVLESRPADAATSLRAIRDSSTGALTELRQTLALFRGSEETVPVTPIADLARLDELVAALQAAGRRIEVRREPDPLPLLGQNVAATGFRIVQESLTNVVRHTDSAAAVVSLRTRADTLEIEVVDDGPPLGGPLTFGGGLNGMAERVAIVGGSLQVEALPAGGVRVAARIPIGGAS